MARFRARRDLASKLHNDGFQVACGGRWLSGAQVAALRDSFLVRTRADDSLAANDLLQHLGRQSAEVFLLNAESGQGKTTLALTMTLQHPGRDGDRLVPFYFSAGPDFEQNFGLWSASLARASRRGSDGLADRPLLIVDGVNETYDASTVVRVIADELGLLRANRVRLMFMFSFRDRSYTGELVAALEEAGISRLQTLRFDDDQIGLQFFPWLLDRSGDAAIVAERVAEYWNEHPSWKRTRREIAALIRWGGTHPGSPPPPPVELVAREYLNDEARECTEELLAVGRIAFVMLGDELSACTPEWLTEELGRSGEGADNLEADLKRWAEVIAAMPNVRLRLETDPVRIDDETAIRALGALHLADRIRRGEIPARLRGRSPYDAAAPFVPFALSWLGEGNTLSTAVESHIESELAAADEEDGRTAPYSFYGRIIFSPYLETRESLELKVFTAIIGTIDADRNYSSREAIRKAKRGESLPVPDPVLDQLFELISGVGEKAVPSLLTLTDAPGFTPLVRSQAAYFLINWLNEPSANPDPALLRRMTTQLGAGDPNLHLRFHQAELVELLWKRAGSDPALRGAIEELGAAVIEAAPQGTSGPPVCGLLHQLVSTYVEETIDGAVSERPRPGTASLREIWTSRMLESERLMADVELRLECWEVALGISALSFRAKGAAETWLSEQIVSALGHELWIIRWWAFANLLGLYEWTCAQGLWSSAATLADRVVNQLYLPGEPVGLKQRQCKLVDDLLARHFSDPAHEHLRVQIRERKDTATDARRSFADEYAELLGQPSEHYLEEYFRRIDRLQAAVI